MPTTLAKKLLIKPEQRIVLLNAPPAYPAALEPLPEAVRISDEPSGPCDMILVFVRNRAQLETSMPAVQPILRPTTLFWIAYQKGGAKAGTDLHRDLLWEAMAPHGWTGVTLIALDDTWSAMRFRPAAG
jgi:hypothetical protein